MPGPTGRPSGLYFGIFLPANPGVPRYTVRLIFDEAGSIDNVYTRAGSSLASQRTNEGWVRPSVHSAQ